MELSLLKTKWEISKIKFLRTVTFENIDYEKLLAITLPLVIIVWDNNYSILF